MRKILTIFFIFTGFLSANAMTLDELNYPALPALRLGTSEAPERQFKNIESQDKKAKDEAREKYAQELTYADLSLKKIAADIADDVNAESAQILGDLAILWSASASKSETIKFTIHKLSDPDEDKPKQTLIKKIIKPVASFSSLAGTAFLGNPFAAAGALIGGNLLGAITADDAEINYRFSKVNDADMVLLVRKIDELQNRLVHLYYDYITTRHILEMANENLSKRYKIYQNSQSRAREQIVVADAYYRMAQDYAKKAQSDFLSKRATLEQLVGSEALREIEENYAKPAQ